MEMEFFPAQWADIWLVQNIYEVSPRSGAEVLKSSIFNKSNEMDINTCIFFSNGPFSVLVFRFVVFQWFSFPSLVARLFQMQVLSFLYAFIQSDYHA
jgi:hypothetical protein